MADCLTVSADCVELVAANQVWMQFGMLLSMHMILLWTGFHSTVQLQILGIIVTTNRQKMRLIICNCSPELSVIIFRSSQKVRNILLYKKKH